MDSNKGLCCCYFMNPVEKTAYISLRLSELPVENVVQNFAISLSNKFQIPSGVSEETLMKIVRSMDTEYDKQCAKMLLSVCNFSYTDMYSLGINPYSAKNLFNGTAKYSGNSTTYVIC